MISRINLLKRKEGLSAEEFSAYLTQAHAGLLATMPYLKGCETNVVVDNEQRSPFDRGSTEIDGYTEMFFDSYGDMVRGMAALEESLAADYAQFAGSRHPGARGGEEGRYTGSRLSRRRQADQAHVLSRAKGRCECGGDFRMNGGRCILRWSRP